MFMQPNLHWWKMYSIFILNVFDKELFLTNGTEKHLC